MRNKETQKMIDKLEEFKAMLELKIEKIDEWAEKRATGERTEQEEEKAEALENTIDLIDELIENLEDNYYL